MHGGWETRLFLGPLHPATGGVVLPRKRGTVQGPALPSTSLLLPPREGSTQPVHRLCSPLPCDKHVDGLDAVSGNGAEVAS